MNELRPQTLLAVAFASVLLLAGPSVADKQNEQPKKPPTATETAPPNANDQKPDKPNSAMKPGRDVNEQLKRQNDTKTSPNAQAVRGVMLEEAKHRKRLARINRLRSLAKKQGNEERLAALNKLETKLNSLHERKVKRWKQRLGDEKYKKLNDRLKRGQGKGNAPNKGKSKTPANTNNKAGENNQKGNANKPTGKVPTQQKPVNANDPDANKGNPKGKVPTQQKPANANDPDANKGNSKGKGPDKPGANAPNKPGKQKGRNDPGKGPRK